MDTYIPAGLDSPDLIKLSCIHYTESSDASFIQLLTQKLNQPIINNELCLADIVNRSANEEGAHDPNAADVEGKHIEVVSLEDEQVWLSRLYEKYAAVQSKSVCCCSLLPSDPVLL